MSVSKAPRDGLAMYYWQMGVGGGRRSFLGLRLVSAIWYCLLYQGLLKPVYTQVLKEGLGPKSELKPMGVNLYVRASHCACSPEHVVGGLLCTWRCDQDCLHDTEALCTG